MKSELYTINVDISPAQAQALLDEDKAARARLGTAGIPAMRNRPIRQRRVDVYQREMAAGRWLLTGEAIKISPEGVLLDGQHRIAAIAAGETTCRMAVCLDVPHEVFLVMDSGISRTASDALGASQRVVAIARLLFELPSAPNAVTTTRQEIAATLAWSQGTIDSVLAHCSAVSRTRSSSPILAAAVIRAMTPARKYAMDAYRALVTVDTAAMEPAVASFFKQISSGAASARENRWGLVCRAWQAFDPKRRDHTKIQVTNPKYAIDEMRQAVMKFRAGGGFADEPPAPAPAIAQAGIQAHFPLPMGAPTSPAARILNPGVALKH